MPAPAAVPQYTAYRFARIEELHDLHERFGNLNAAAAARAEARAVAAELGAVELLPAWARLREGEAPPQGEPPRASPKPLTSTVAESVSAPVELPRYTSIRAWARAGNGSRAIVWHAGSEAVSLVLLVTDTDRRRSQTFASEAEALFAIAAGTIVWAKPRAAKHAHKRRLTRAA